MRIYIPLVEKARSADILAINCGTRLIDRRVATPLLVETNAISTGRKAHRAGTLVSTFRILIAKNGYIQECRRDAPIVKMFGYSFLPIVSSLRAYYPRCSRISLREKARSDDTIGRNCGIRLIGRRVAAILLVETNAISTGRKAHRAGTLVSTFRILIAKNAYIQDCRRDAPIVKMFGYSFLPIVSSLRAYYPRCSRIPFREKAHRADLFGRNCGTRLIGRRIATPLLVEINAKSMERKAHRVGTLVSTFRILIAKNAYIQECRRAAPIVKMFDYSFLPIVSPLRAFHLYSMQLSTKRGVATRLQQLFF